MFLISLVCLLGLSSSVLAADLEIPYGTTYTVSGTEEYGDMECEGTCVIPAGATLTLNSESDVDGGGPDGVGGVVLVDGGTFIINDRINFGCDHDAYLIIDNGGIVEHDGDKITVPDNEGGEHRIIILDGSMVAEEIEIIHDRDAKVILGCNATIEVCNTDEDDSRDPDQWLADGDLLCDVSCSFGIMRVTDLGNDCKEAICFRGCPPPWCSWWPGPWDGSTGVCPGVCLTWFAGYGMGAHPGDKHYVYFGTSYDAVDDAEIGDPPYRGFKPVGLEEYCPIEDPTLGYDIKLWTTYYWRVDEKPFGEPTRKCAVWSFTTGCEIMPGDINLDCVVDGKDYAMLADDWMNTSFFPDDF